MASSYTDIGTELMATGENAGTWGTKTNTNIQILEEAINGYVSQALTSSGTVALTYTDGSTGDVARHAVIALTGTITGNAVVTVPANEKVWIIDNQSSGAYTVTVKVSGQTGVTWGTSDKGTKILYANGTDVVDTNIGGGVGAHDLNGNSLTLDADADTDITADTDDQIDIKVGGTDRVRITTSAIAPSSSDGVALGTSSLEFADLFLADGAVINFGDDQDVSLTHVADTGLLLSSTDQLQFGDSGTYIHQSADGVLDLVSDTEIEINATTIDINGAVAMDGAITGATNITLSGELDAATLDISGDADIDGTLETDALSINGTTITTTAAEINLIDGGTARGTTAVADGDGLLVNDAGTMRMTNVTTLKTYFQTGVTAAAIAADDISTGDGAVTIATSSGNITIDATANDSDIIFKGTDNSSDITMLTLDGSEAGAATFNNKVIATELDISGDTDIDGTANLDNTDIDGTLAVDGTTISLDATTSLNIDNSNTSNGITIGTATSGVPISIGHTTSEVTVNDNLTITGDLTVNGTTTTVNSTTVTVDDPIFTLGGDTAPGSDDNKDRGIEFRYHDGSSARIGFFGFDDSATAFTFLTAASNSSEVFSGTVGNIVVGTVSATSVDADGGVTVDNITIDGTEIDLSSGDLTIDVAGDLILEAGADVNVPANIGVTFGDDGEKIEGDGTDLTIASSAKINLTATSDIHVPNNVGIVFGGDSEKIEGDGTDLTISANNLTVDAAADIILDAAGNNVTFKSGGTSILDISNSSSDAVITASVQDKDIVFKGDDNGSAITALTLDMSEAGAATFNSTVTSGAGLVIADAGNIGSASDTDAIAIASNGVVTFSQAPVFPDGSIAIADLDIDGATDIGEAIVDADLFIVDNGAGGTNRKVAASRLITYVDANANFASTGKAIAMAIVFG